jgi:pyruvate dehydrogenase E2 component (dihydrolipoamide acetyltransferase)
MEEGTLSKWLVKEGDAVKSGDVLAEIETDKAVMEFEAVDEGKIGKILVPEGSEGVKVNTPIAVLLGEDEEQSDAEVAAMPQAGNKAAAKSQPAKQAETSSGAAQPPASEAAQAAAAGKQAPAAGAAKEAGGAKQQAGAPTQPSAARIFASPLARRIAREKGIDLASLSGSGPRGRIVKADVEQARPVAGPAGAGAQMLGGIAALPDAKLFYRPDDYEEVAHDSMRKAIAKRLTAAKALIPHYYLTIDCRLDSLLATRARLNEAAGKDADYKLSVNDFIIKASAMALMKHPDVNASWTEESILRHRHADVGVAVALPFGLITPIVFRAEEKGLAEISNEVKALAAKARDKKLKPAEYEGGGFSVSNLGMFGIKNFTAVINPPQAAILAVGAGEERPIAVNGKIEVATIMTVTMSCDHRVIDGARGAQFLQSFKRFIEEPASMLL